MLLYIAVLKITMMIVKCYITNFILTYQVVETIDDKMKLKFEEIT